MTTPLSDTDRRRHAFIGLTLTVVFAAVALGAAILFARSGFDITDESYYLASIADPSHYVASLSFFGEAYHPAYLLLGGSIVGLRLLNLCVTAALSFALSLLIVRRYLGPLQRVSGGAYRATCQWAYSFGLSTAALSIASLHGKWLVTPSYNSLAFAGLLVAAIAMVLCVSADSEPPLLSWVLLGVGGWLSFMGKSSTAALLAVATLLALIAARRAKVAGLLMSVIVALGLLGISAVAISGSLVKFVERFMLGLQLLRLQSTGYDPSDALARLWTIPMGPRAWTLYILSFGFLGYGWLTHGRRRYGMFAGLFVAVLTVSLIVYRTGIGNAYAKEAFIQLLWALAVVAGCLWLAAGARFRNVYELGRRGFVLSIYLLVLPIVYAFGTSNNYLTQANMAGVFWVLGAVLFASTLLTGQSERVLTLLALFVSISSALTVLMAAESPYRQDEPLRKATERVFLGPYQSQILVSKARAQFVRTVQAAGRRSGFPPDQPTIDLSGVAPGTLFIYGAKGVGLAWMLSGFTGSEATIRAALLHVPCSELAGAWVLASTSKDASDPKILSVFGSSLQRDYLPVATWKSPADLGVETLYKPIRSDQVAARACASTRE